MPKCAKCSRSTFDGTRWNSLSKCLELNGKYLCKACITELSSEQPITPSPAPTKSNDKCCANCGKEIGFFEKTNSRFWTAQLKEGYLDFTTLYGQNEQANKRIMEYCHIPKGDHRFNVPEFRGKLLCFGCAFDLWWSKEFEKRFKEALEQNKPQIIVTDDIAEKSMISKRVELISEAGQKYGFLFKDKSEDFVKNKEGISGVYVNRVTLVYEKKQPLNSVHIVLDFSSLKDVMSKGGLVMTTYKCPNCNGMVPIPEAGKVLMCEYCGTPIKPVDIFEKIKSLIQ